MEHECLGDLMHSKMLQNTLKVMPCEIWITMINDFQEIRTSHLYT